MLRFGQASVADDVLLDGGEHGRRASVLRGEPRHTTPTERQLITWLLPQPPAAPARALPLDTDARARTRTDVRAADVAPDPALRARATRVGPGGICFGDAVLGWGVFLLIRVERTTRGKLQMNFEQVMGFFTVKRNGPVHSNFS